MKGFPRLMRAFQILFALTLFISAADAQEIDRNTYEPVLLPVWTNGVQGAYNTNWSTTLGLGNPHPSPVLGLANIQCPFECSTDFLVAPHDVIQMRLLSPPPDRPATVIYVQREPSQPMHYTLLLRLGSIEGSRVVTTIPTVRESELFDRQFLIPAVPVEEEVRYRLRVYDLSGDTATATVRIHGDFIGQLLLERTITLLSSESVFSPSYGEIALDGLPFGPFHTFSIEITPVQQGRAQMWALLTATHNGTQNVVIYPP